MAPNSGQMIKKRFTKQKYRSIDFKIDVLETLNNKHKSKKKNMSSRNVRSMYTAMSHEMNDLHEGQNLNNFRKKHDMTWTPSSGLPYAIAYRAPTKLWELTFVILYVQ